MEAMCECGCTFVWEQAGRFPKMKIDEYARGNVFNNLFFIIIIYSRRTYKENVRGKWNVYGKLYKVYTQYFI